MTSTEQGGDTRLPPPPQGECHRTPTLIYNTLLKAISDHNIKRLEYRWLGQDRGGHQIPLKRLSVTGYPPSMHIPCWKPFRTIRVKDWSIVDFEQDRGTPGSPLPPRCQCHRTPTLNANTLLKAISDHKSERLEYRWLGQDRGDTKFPPSVPVSQDTHPQCQYPAKSHFGP